MYERTSPLWVGDLPPLVERAQPFSDLVEADSKVRKFNTEVLSNAETADPMKTSGPFGTFPARWYTFFTTWDVFFAGTDARNKDIQSKTFGLAPEVLTGDGAKTFEQLMLDFNGFVSEFKKLGGASSVDPVDTRSRAEKAGASLFSGLSDAFTGAASGVTTVLVYAAAIGAVGLGLYYFAPAILAKGASLVKRAA